jgi:poly(3-hydroxybutyrate) depolymerase
VDQAATGVRLSTFAQPTKDCGSVTRRYLSYVPKSLAARSDAPVVIVLHGLGADAESMRAYITRGRFEALAERDGFIVVYGNAAPSAGTVIERPNGGGFRKDAGAPQQVNDFAYLDGIIDELAAKGAISGKNPLFLAGLSDGGGLSHMAALKAPTRFQGIAEVMPYPGVTVPMPPASGGFTLKRVLLAYSVTDPGLPAGYDVALAKLGPAWAAALALSSEEQRAPQTHSLPDRVSEGVNYQGTAPNALRTRDSRAEQIDYGSDPSSAQVRVLRFDHAGHLWPVPNPPDREQEITQFGFRNQDIDMSDVIWDFFRSSL